MIPSSLLSTVPKLYTTTSPLAVVHTILLCSLLILTIACKENHQQFPTSKESPPEAGTLIIGFFQDVSRSITNNGVVLVNSNHFKSYYDLLNVHVRLYVGIIGDSAMPLINVDLPAKSFTKPVLPDLSQRTVTEKRKLKTNYLHFMQLYIEDSTSYWADRLNRIHVFSRSVDTLMNSYRGMLVAKTDINTPLVVSEKLFSYTGKSPAKCFIILNSDGLNSKDKEVMQFNKAIPIVLVNAGGQRHCSLDSIVTITLESVSQAIEYTLNM